MSSLVQLDAAVSRARVFVDRHGSQLACLAVRVLVGEAQAEEIERCLQERQEPSGALASFQEEVGAGLSSSAEALVSLADLRLLHLPCAERAACFITSSQLADGSFAETPDAGIELRLQQSGRLAPVLARMRCISLDRLEALGGFLAAQWSIERVQGGRYEDLAPFLPFFAVHPHELSDVALQWCGRELERSFRSGRLSALEAGRLFVRSDARCLPGARLDGREILPALIAEQRPDGGFGSQHTGARARVEATVASIVALLRLG